MQLPLESPQQASGHPHSIWAQAAPGSVDVLRGTRLHARLLTSLHLLPKTNLLSVFTLTFCMHEIQQAYRNSAYEYINV